ncbi:hypothetical protein AN958_03788 [Leucoagaricus sp. SymC.cos]|nr:hypothetical protein AN958_03788 [Leucoagaricus sp. SymC.cos]
MSLAPTCKQLLACPNAILAEKSRWRDFNVDSIAFPESKPHKTWIEAHSIPSLLTNWKPRMKLVIASHRGQFNTGGSIPENTPASFLMAIKLGFHILEINIVFSKDNHLILGHNWNTQCTTLLPNQPWNTLLHKEIEGADIINCEVDIGQFKETFVVTDQKVTVLDCLLPQFAPYPEVTTFLDCCEDDGAKATAWVSHRPQYHENLIVQFYPYQHHDGFKFIKDVTQHNPATDWKKKVAIMPVLFPDQVEAIAERYFLAKGEPKDKLTFDDLLMARKNWVDSMFAQGMHMKGMSFIISMMGDHYDVTTGKVELPNACMFSQEADVMFFC